jgi:hypothetical protein
LKKTPENKAEIAQVHERHPAILDRELNSLENKSRWEIYTSEEGILEEHENGARTAYWRLDKDSEYIQTLKENTELNL